MTRGARCLALCLAVWAGDAYAHVPHNDMIAGSADRDLAGEHPWVLLHATGSSTLLLASDDGGDTWNAFSGPPNADLLTDVGRTNDGVLVLLAEARYWWSADDGETWEFEDLDASPTGLAAGDGILITTEAGVRIGPPGELAESDTDTAFAAPAYGPGGFTALDGAGGVWTSGSGDWAALPEAPEPSTAAVATTDGVYVGSASGSVRWWDGSTWLECAPPQIDAEHPAIVALASDDLRVVVSAAGHGPALSDDGCVSWDDIAAPMDTDFDNSGGAQSDAEATTLLAVAGDHIIQAGWDGFAWSTDGGATWSKRVVLPADYIRAAAISPEVDRDGRVLLGGYSAGVERSDDGGASWDAPGIGLEEANVPGPVDFAPDNPDVVYAVVEHQLWRSNDGGSSWLAPNTPFASLNDLLVVSSMELWLCGDPLPGNPFVVTGTIAHSVDGGLTWAGVPGVGVPDAVTELYAGGPATPADGGPTQRICALAGGTLQCSTDSGRTWETTWGGASSVRGVVAVTVSGVERLVIATLGDGILTLDEGAQVLAYDGTADPVVELTGADDSTVFAGTRSGRLLRSTDAGTSWTDLEVQFTAAVSVMAARPGFAEHPELLVGTYDGAWLVTESGSGGESGSGEESGVVAERFGRYQRLDDRSGYVDIAGTRARSDPEAAMGNCTPMPTGSTVAGSARGTVIRVWGSSDGSGEVRVWIDGQEVGTTGGRRRKQGTLLFESAVLEDDWHRVELTGDGEGEALCLDAIEGSASGAVLADVGSGCGCGAGGGRGAGTVGLALLLAASGWRRRAGASWGRPRGGW